MSACRKRQLRFGKRLIPVDVLKTVVLFLFCLFFTTEGKSQDFPFDGKWRGAITCGSVASEVAFKSPRRIDIKKNRITLRRGKPNRNKFEAWEGSVDASGTVLIFGYYFWKLEKPLWFKGQIDGRTLKAKGQRGPRVCELLLIPVSDANKRKEK